MTRRAASLSFLSLPRFFKEEINELVKIRRKTAADADSGYHLRDICSVPDPVRRPRRPGTFAAGRRRNAGADRGEEGGNGSGSAAAGSLCPLYGRRPAAGLRRVLDQRRSGACPFCPPPAQYAPAVYPCHAVCCGGGYAFGHRLRHQTI